MARRDRPAPCRPSSWQIELVGPTNTLRQLPPDLEFSVFLDPPKNPDSSAVVVEFGIDDLTARSGDERIDALLRTMTPTRIAVKLVQHGESPPIDINPERVTATNPDTPHIKSSELQFSRSSVVLRGPAMEVRTVEPKFVVHLKPGPDKQLRGVLALAGDLFDKFEMTETVIVTLPERPNFLNVMLTVPVLLDTNLTQHSADVFERPPAQEIGLAVAGPLRRELIDKTRTQLDEWARRNLRLCAVLPANTTLDGQPVQLELFFLNPRQRRLGIDYSVQRTQPIQVRAKKR